VEACLFIAFSSLDLFIFYICFEGITVPTFFIIYLFGAELTKLRASIVFLISSFLSSGFITIALVALYSQAKTSGIYQLLLKTMHTKIYKWYLHPG
jgi:NADH:ubiquinone oxidoreductase subunit 4 (subunit M)